MSHTGGQLLNHLRLFHYKCWLISQSRRTWGFALVSLSFRPVGGIS
jgi:hypothetical protein